MVKVSDYLVDKWNKLATEYNEKQLTEKMFDELVAAYSEPHRYYHTLTHLEYLFKELEAMSIDGVLSEAIQWSVWYHDVIYQPRSGKNEEKSAELAVKHLAVLDVDHDIADQVQKFIVATKTHKTNEPDCQLFLDADMAILGAPLEQYIDYVEKIRLEFKSIPTFLYNRGRKKFIEPVLKRPCIFLTEKFQDKYEQQARLNLKYELGL